MNKKILIFLAAVAVVLILGFGGYYFWPKQKAAPVVTKEQPSSPKTVTNFQCGGSSDCQNGAACMVEGPLIAGQPVRKVCVPKGEVVPL